LRRRKTHGIGLDHCRAKIIDESLNLDAANVLNFLRSRAEDGIAQHCDLE
jgi:hypothetical protein